MPSAQAPLPPESQLAATSSGIFQFCLQLIDQVLNLFGPATHVSNTPNVISIEDLPIGHLTAAESIRAKVEQVGE